LWIAYLAGAASASPVSVTEVASFILSAFNLGMAGWMCWQFFQNKLHSDGEMERVRAEAALAVERARADLLRENERLIAEKSEAIAKADAALGMAQERLVPLLTSFVATSQSLIPLLQELVRNRER